MAIQYFKGAELPDAEITWLDSDGDIIDFSSGYTFQVKIGVTGSTALVTKTSGITGFAVAPNIVISWDVDELGTIAVGTYAMDIKANLTATSKDRIQSTTISIVGVVT